MDVFFADPGRSKLKQAISETCCVSTATDLQRGVGKTMTLRLDKLSECCNCFGSSVWN